MNGADPLPPSFVDTNIFVYAFNSDEAERARFARGFLDRLMQARALRISTQVLQELFVTLTRKGDRPVDPEEALRSLDQLARFPVFTVDYPAVRAAVELSRRDKLSFWDSLIIVAAARSGAARLYTEDLQHGRHILGVEIINPFRNR